MPAGLLFLQRVIHEEREEHVFCDPENMVNPVNMFMVEQDVVQHLRDVDHLFPGIGTQWTVYTALVHANKPVQLCEVHNDVVFVFNHDEASWISYTVRGDELVCIYREAVEIIQNRC